MNESIKFCSSEIGRAITAVNVKRGTVRTPPLTVHTFELFREEDVHLEYHRVADELKVDGPDFSQILWSDDCSALLS